MGKGREGRSTGSREEGRPQSINKHKRTWTKPGAASSCALSGQRPAPLAPSSCREAVVDVGGKGGEGGEVIHCEIRPDLSLGVSLPSQNFLPFAHNSTSCSSHPLSGQAALSSLSANTSLSPRSLPPSSSPTKARTAASRRRAAPLTPSFPSPDAPQYSSYGARGRTPTPTNTAIAATTCLLRPGEHRFPTSSGGAASIPRGTGGRGKSTSPREMYEHRGGHTPSSFAGSCGKGGRGHVLLGGWSRLRSLGWERGTHEVPGTYHSPVSS